MIKFNVKNREKLLTLMAALVIGLLIADHLVITPLANLWKTRSNRIETLTKSINNGNLLLSREKIIRDRWDYMKTNSLSANVSAAENRVLKSVDRWVQDSQISFTSIKPQWKQGDDDYMTLECQADAYGNIRSVARFLFELEKDPLSLKVDNVEIAARDSEGQQLTLSVRFSGLRLLADQK
ncbi:MAG: hypothetical protein M1608_04255 [Candidatus Omnitrophica bacterium]|nr:hypothetical protein [Candidatus Omnitrophota bacterium]